MRRFLTATLASLAAITALPASAAVITHTGSFITVPSAGTDFESVPVLGAKYNTPLKTGGVSVTYVDANFGTEDCCVQTGGYDLGGGARGWTGGLLAQGYTSVKLASGGSFNQIQFLAASDPGVEESTQLSYSILNGANVIANGNAGQLDHYLFEAARTYGFSGATFTEVRLWSRRPFEGNLDYAIFDNFIVGGAAAPVPEPSTWALLIGGFALAGAALRRQTRTPSLARTA